MTAFIRRAENGKVSNGFLHLLSREIATRFTPAREIASAMPSKWRSIGVRFDEMFSELYEVVLRLWSRRWPRATGEITAVDIERVTNFRSGKDVLLRLAVAYKFSIGDDGPYTGESFWDPAFCPNRRVLEARRKMRVHHPVTVRYRPSDPSLNTLDRATWKEF